MYKDVLRAIEGISIYPLIALLFFFTFFVGVLVWAIRLRHDYIEEMGHLPLDHDSSADDPVES